MSPSHTAEFTAFWDTPQSVLSPIASANYGYQRLRHGERVCNLFKRLGSGIGKLLNLSNLRVTKLSARVPFSGRCETDYAGVSEIVGVRTPLQVFRTVVRFCAVLVVHLRKIVWIRNERLSNKPMNIRLPGHFNPILLNSENNLVVADGELNRRKLYPLAAFSRANLSGIADFVITARSANWFPHGVGVVRVI